MEDTKKNGTIIAKPQPLSLFRVHDYTGYQLYAKVRYKGQKPDYCMRYCIAVVLDWLRKKIPDHVYPDAIIAPDPEAAAQDNEIKFQSCHYSKGYSFDITSLPDDGIWALNVHEPDSDRMDRPGVVGRIIVTDVGLYQSEKDYIELGLKTTILDPASAEELPSSFRPAIVRTLLLAENIEVTHVQPMQYCHVIGIDSKEDARRFRQNMSDRDQCLPAVIFTYERKSIRETIRSAEEEMNLNGKFGALQALIDKINSEDVFDEALPSLPYDVKEFAHRTYGYGWTYLVADDMFEKFSAEFDCEMHPGDVIFTEPRQFISSGTVSERTLYLYADHQTGDLRDRLFDDLMKRVLYYSKEKDVCYHQIVFERQARNRENERTIAAAKARGEGEMESGLGQLFDELNLDNDRLLAANDELKGTIRDLKRVINERDAYIESTRAAYDRAKSMQEALDNLRTFEKLPETNSEVILYFQKVFGDRMDFTNQGRKTAEKCGLTPSTLWATLYVMASHLPDLYASEAAEDVEKHFLERTGLALSLHEGKETHRNNKLDRERVDYYDGREIWIEPHVKIKSAKGDPDYQRIYYAYDTESGKIIIGYLGHLPNSLTRKLK